MRLAGCGRLSVRRRCVSLAALNAEPLRQQGQRLWIAGDGRFPVGRLRFLVLVGVSVLLTATHVVVTQIIRLRASRKITRSQDALGVLEIEDLPHRDRQRK
jgi:hypothetical protein